MMVREKIELALRPKNKEKGSDERIVLFHFKNFINPYINLIFLYRQGFRILKYMFTCFVVAIRGLRWRLPSLPCVFPGRAGPTHALRNRQI